MKPPRAPGPPQGRDPTRSHRTPRPPQRRVPPRPPARGEPPSRDPAPRDEPRRREAFSVFGGAIETGGDPKEAPALGDLFHVDETLSRSLTHGFHSYAARLHPSIARGAIARYSKAGDRVLDPFCGSGTVLVEAFAAGRGALGVDASPLAVQITQVRSTPMNGARRARLVELAGEISEVAAERARTRQKPEFPPWSREERERFHPHVLLELLGLRQLVFEVADGEDDADIARALRLSLSSILIKFMKLGPAAPHDGEDKRIGRGVPSRFLAARVRELAAGLEDLEIAARTHTVAPAVRLGDARATEISKASIGLIVSSPPYAGVYDYADQHEVRFRWLGLPIGKFRARQIGVRGPGTAAGAWRQARQAWLAEMARVLQPGGHAVVVIGDGVVDDRAEDARAGVAADAPDKGLQVVAWASQARPAPERRLGVVFQGRPRHEHIILLRR